MADSSLPNKNNLSLHGIINIEVISFTILSRVGNFRFEEDLHPSYGSRTHRIPHIKPSYFSFRSPALPAKIMNNRHFW